jgi:hypothetical protein
MLSDAGTADRHGIAALARRPARSGHRPAAVMLAGKLPAMVNPRARWCTDDCHCPAQPRCGIALATDRSPRSSSAPAAAGYRIRPSAEAATPRPRRRSHLSPSRSLPAERVAPPINDEAERHGHRRRTPASAQLRAPARRPVGRRLCRESESLAGELETAALIIEQHSATPGDRQLLRRWRGSLSARLIGRSQYAPARSVRGCCVGRIRCSGVSPQ